ncbi:MAG: biotin--[acetyl-CoA-carboxylase] ligase [Clostridiales bacterium]|nr:biotin--[acetyl-CoA-carboxylase] ligase [Clostridiales bacterium]
MISTKDFVLSKLLNAEEFISGEVLSSELNISRAAVNTAVRTLKADGYDITSTTNKGYRLMNHPDILSPGEVRAKLPKRDNVIVLPEVDSTNKYLKELAYEGAADRTVVISDCQTAGRGRLGRSFHSPSGTGIYLSYLMRPTVKPEFISTITCWSAVAVANAISSVCDITPSIKWVNDLLINDMKICGILTEMNIEPEIGAISSVVIGIGINVNESRSEFPLELQSIASSIRHESKLKEPIHRASLAAALIEELDKMCSLFPSAHEEYLKSYRKLCSTVGLNVSVVNAHNHTSEIPRLGKATGVGDDFSLQVKFEDGHTENLSSGEVSIIRR